MRIGKWRRVVGRSGWEKRFGTNLVGMQVVEVPVFVKWLLCSRVRLIIRSCTKPKAYKVRDYKAKP